MSATKGTTSITSTAMMVGSGGGNAKNSSSFDGGYLRPVLGFVICFILTRLLIVMKPIHIDDDGTMMQRSDSSLLQEEVTNANIFQRMLVVLLPFQHYNNQDNPQQQQQQQLVLLLILLAVSVYVFVGSASTSTINPEKTTTEAQASKEMPHKYVGLDPKRYNNGNDGNDSDAFLSNVDGKGYAHTNLASHPMVWLIHGKEYDLNDFVSRHPGGKESILLGRGRDCTAMFDSYHAFTNQHRYV